MKLRKQKGFSLVELMVSIVIGMILIAGVLSIFLSSKVTYTTNEKTARLQSVAIGLLVYAAYRLYKGARTSGIVIGLLGIGFLAWFLLTDTVPREFTGMTPYVTTLLVLAFASQRLRMPAADGQIYRKGEGQ